VNNFGNWHFSPAILRNHKFPVAPTTTNGTRQWQQQQQQQQRHIFASGEQCIKQKP